MSKNKKQTAADVTDHDAFMKENSLVFFSAEQIEEWKKDNAKDTPEGLYVERLAEYAKQFADQTMTLAEFYAGFQKFDAECLRTMNTKAVRDLDTDTPIGRRFKIAMLVTYPESK